MFKDRDKALEEMNQALLEEEEPEEVLEEYDDFEEFFAPGETPDTYNGDKAPEDLDSYSRELLGSPKKDSLTGLAVTCIVLTLAILAVVGYLALRFGR